MVEISDYDLGQNEVSSSVETLFGDSSSSSSLTDKALAYQGSTKKVQRNYPVYNAASGTAAMVQLWGLLPFACPENTALLLMKDQCSFQEFAAPDGTTSHIDVTIVWADPSWDGVAGSFSIQFDVSGQSQTIKQAYDQTSYSPSSSSAPDFGTSIGVNQDHTVSGCEITIPVVTLNYECGFSPGTITNSWIAGVAAIVGKINSGGYLGFNAGELLLTRVSGQRRSNELWTVTFGISYSQNRTNFNIGTGDNQITIGSKNGWQYLWTYEETQDNGDSSDSSGPFGTFPQLLGAYVADVYQQTDFSPLGISSLSLAGSA